MTKCGMPNKKSASACRRQMGFTEAGRTAGEDEKNAAGVKDLETVEEPVDITVHRSQVNLRRC